MRVRWLNDELTEAIVTIGHLWWKRHAHVRYVPYKEDISLSLWERWQHCVSGRPFEFRGEIERSRTREIAARRRRADWFKGASPEGRGRLDDQALLPKARLVKQPSLGDDAKLQAAVVE